MNRRARRHDDFEDVSLYEHEHDHEHEKCKRSARVNDARPTMNASKDRHKPRIVQLVPTLSGGGAERQFCYLCAGLVESGWDVHAGFVRGGPNMSLLEESGAKLHQLPASSMYDPRLLLHAIRLIRTTRSTLVQTWNPMMDIVGGLASLYVGVPWIMTERNSPDFYPPAVKMQIRAILGRRATAIVSNSYSGDTYWRTRCKPTLARRVVRNTLPIDVIAAEQPAQASNLDLPEDVPMILFAGRLTAQKNISILGQAISHALEQSNAVAVIGGEGELDAELESIFRKRGLSDRIRMPGFLPSARSWMKHASVFVSVSLFEGMPNAVMEAMACGCPLVVSDIPPHREILDDSMARMVAYDDPSLIGDAILEVLRDLPNAKLRAEGARKRAKQWSIDAMVKGYTSLYNEIVADPGVVGAHRKDFVEHNDSNHRHSGDT
jgi:glycosyltransferase involved in cell wall biosynthesis